MIELKAISRIANSNKKEFNSETREFLIRVTLEIEIVMCRSCFLNKRNESDKFIILANFIFLPTAIFLIFWPQDLVFWCYIIIFLCSKLNIALFAQIFCLKNGAKKLSNQKIYYISVENLSQNAS